MNGFNNFDMVCFINLDHRTDRLKQITEQLNKTNIDQNKINRIPGIYKKDFGSLGCSKSQVLALETFVNSPKSNQTCLILEDDFEFTQPQYIVNDLINKVFNSDAKNFDVLMLSSNTVYQYNIDNTPFVTKIIDAQTLSGYIVSRKFAPLLLHNFKQGVSLLEPFGKSVPEYCVDMYCKKLQPLSNWYCINPKIGKQAASYSDIEKGHVNYGV
jgi:GR25 family glycosyltransferase involved in LPS biosynthesis